MTIPHGTWGLRGSPRAPMDNSQRMVQPRPGPRPRCPTLGLPQDPSGATGSQERGAVTVDLRAKLVWQSSLQGGGLCPGLPGDPGTVWHSLSTTSPEKERAGGGGSSRCGWPGGLLGMVPWGWLCSGFQGHTQPPGDESPGSRPPGDQPRHLEQILTPEKAAVL